MVLQDVKETPVHLDSQVSEVSMALLVPMDYRVPPAPLGPPPSPTAS